VHVTFSKHEEQLTVVLFWSFKP